MIIALIPFPKKHERGKGHLVLKADCPVAAADGLLTPLAAVAADGLALLFGANSHIANGSGETGGIALSIDARLGEEAYELEVGDRVVVRGGGYKGVAWGLAALLQAAETDGGRIIIPRMKISDQPFAQYRGLLLDVARQWHPIEAVKQAVVLCHWYRIGHLQLHLTDDQSWTFPSAAFPQLATPGRQYTLQQLRDLESFASARGVTIVPELEAPGHAGALVNALPDTVGTDPLAGNAVSPGRESTYEAMDSIVGEVCEVFASTPYFHTGSDEVRKSAWAECRYCREYREQHGISSDEELYRHFIVRMNDIVKKHGKRTIVWEGFKVAGDIEIPKDITVMEFECFYELPQNLVAAGYTVINTSWKPLYVVNDRNWSPEEILSWNVYRWENFNKGKQSAAYPDGIDVAPTPLVTGAQMCAWEQPAEAEIPSLRHRLPAMSERLWDHESQRTFADFSTRLTSTDAKLTRLLAG